MLEEIRDRLVANGITTTIKGGVTPSLPDKVIALHDSTGFEPERVMGGIAAEKRNLQVLVRDVTYSGAEALAEQVFNLLDNFTGTLGTTRYLSILARTTPFSLGADENKRTTFSCNYVVTKARA